MNVKQKILDLNMQHTDNETAIEDLLITIVTNFQLFEPCKYLAEDEDWINIAMISVEDESLSQAMSIKKSEIVMLGIFNPAEIEMAKQIKTEPEDFYQ